MQRIVLKNKSLPYFFILPTVLLICIFKLSPIVNSIFLSLTSKKTPGLTLRNYILLFKDKFFWNSVIVTFKMNLIMIPLQIAVAFCYALLVNTRVKGITAFRTMFFLPFCVSISISAIIWKMMLNVNDGVINSFLRLFNVSNIGFLTDKRYALLSIVLICSWRGCAYWMMFFLAGLKGISTEIYEAAQIDGCAFFQRLFMITIPLLKHTFLFVLVANTTANFLLFAPIQLATEGGPQNSTNVLMYEAYKSAFSYSNVPRSSCIIVILLFIIGLTCIIQHKFMSDKE